MNQWFAVDHLDVERLLAQWRWLCSRKMALVARTAFGDLFLRDEAGVVSWLDTDVGRLTKVSDSEAEFREMAETAEKRAEWFAEADEQACAKRGLSPDISQCIAFSIPLVFAKSGSPSNKPYLIDLYEHVSFLGELNQQISDLPDGANARLQIRKPPSS
jgi:hypothetical protein